MELKYFLEDTTTGEWYSPSFQPTIYSSIYGFLCNGQAIIKFTRNPRELHRA